MNSKKLEEQFSEVLMNDVVAYNAYSLAKQQGLSNKDVLTCMVVALSKCNNYYQEQLLNLHRGKQQPTLYVNS